MAQVVTRVILEQQELNNAIHEAARKAAGEKVGQQVGGLGGATIESFQTETKGEGGDAKTSLKSVVVIFNK